MVGLIPLFSYLDNFTILCRNKLARFCSEPLNHINHQVVIFAKLDLLTFIIDRIYIGARALGKFCAMVRFYFNYKIKNFSQTTDRNIWRIRWHSVGVKSVRSVHTTHNISDTGWGTAWIIRYILYLVKLFIKAYNDFHYPLICIC